MIFADTNVLIYAFDDADERKHQIGQALFRSATRYLISTQVVGEFVNVALRKRLFTSSELELLVGTIESAFHVVPVTSDTFREALGVRGRYGFSWWDSVVVASALHAGCDVLLSEDLHDGQRIGGRLTVGKSVCPACGVTRQRRRGLRAGIFGRTDQPSAEWPT
jgi:predicted nucleic acid-binding protein